MNTRFGWALASAILLGSIGSAYAADMPMKAMPMKAPPVAVYNWTGFYIGGHVGGIWDNTRRDVYPTGCFLSAAPNGCGGVVPGASGVPLNPLRSDSVRLNGSGFTGGGQVGYNWQGGAFVGGIEADINYSGLNDRNAINRPLLPPLAGNYI